jgi:hypothetical protein
VVAATVTTTTKKDVAIDEVQKKVTTPTVTDVERAGTLQLRTIADDTTSYTLDLGGAMLRDTSIGIDVAGGGLLKTVSSASTGRAGELVQAIGRFVGLALGSLPSVAFLPARVAGAVPAGKEAPLLCDIFAGDLRIQPKRVRGFVYENADGCALYNDIRAHEQTLMKLQRQRAEKALELGSLPDAQVKSRQKLLQELTLAVIQARDVVDRERAAFATAIEGWAQAKGLGAKTKTETFTQTFSLKELPESLNKLSDSAAMRAFEAISGVVVTAAAVAKPESPAKDDMPSGGGDLIVWYRESTPFRFEMFTRNERDAPGDPATYTSAAVVLADAIPAGAAKRAIEFDTSAWAKRTVGVTFDDRGRPVRLDRSSGATAASVALAVTDATRGARDEYAASLGKLVEIQDARRKVELSGLTTKIEELKKKKESLDAQLALESGTANFDVLLQQNQLSADLSLLQSQYAKASYEAGYDRRLEIEALKQQVEVLRQQVDLLKAQRELEKVSKGSSPEV